MADRNELRAALLDQRSQLAAVDIERASIAVARRVLDLPVVVAATRIAAYRAVRGELDADAVVQWAWNAGGVPIYPSRCPCAT